MDQKWLLVGGPAHGKMVWVKGGKSILWPLDGCGYAEYVGRDVLFEGVYYRIGSQEPLNEDQQRYVNETLSAMKSLDHKNHVQGHDGPDWGADIG